MSEKKTKKVMTANRATLIEDKMIEGIDEVDRLLAKLTNDEQIAAKIVFGSEKPTDTRTRKWAIKVWREVMETELVSKAATHVITSDNVEDCMALFPYFVPHAKQAVELTGEDGGPIGFQVVTRIPGPDPLPDNLRVKHADRD